MSKARPKYQYQRARERILPIRSKTYSPQVNSGYDFDMLTKILGANYT